LNIIFVDSLPERLRLILRERGFNVIQGEKLSVLEVLEQSGLQDCGIVIRSRFPINQDFLQSTPHRIKFIARFGAGMENIDTRLCASMGIKCYHSSGGNREAVADHALGLLISLSKRISKSFMEVQNGLWLREPNRGWEIDGKTMGILGFGNTGSVFAKRLRGFDCKVLAYDKYLPEGYAREFDHVMESDLETIFQNADVLSLHLPLTSETLGCIDEAFLARFNKPICLINTSRGKIVNTSSVITMLDRGALTGFGADVLDIESGSFENLDVNAASLMKRLFVFDNVVVTPHVAGWSHEANEKMSVMLAAQIMEDFPLT